MNANFSVVQVEVKNDEGTILRYVRCIEGLSALGQQPIIDFTDNPWEASRPTLCNALFERVYEELSNEQFAVTYHRLCATTGIVRNQTVQVQRADITLEGWKVTTHLSKASPTLAIQSLNEKENKIVVLNF